jgi:hypothetical protein
MLGVRSMTRVVGGSFGAAARRRALAFARVGGVLVGMAGCSQEVLPGERFAVTVAGPLEGTDCGAFSDAYSETFTYRVVSDGPSVQIYVDEALLAVGSFNGCDLVYSSSTFTDPRPDGVVRWRMEGVAEVALSNSGCVPEQGDWYGEETIRVTESADPAVPDTCSYLVTTSGQRLDEGE